MAKSLYPNLPIQTLRGRSKAVKIYGKTFPYTDIASQAKAVRDAEQYGLQRQQAMRAQAARDLTAREEITGRIELPAEPSRPRSLRKPPQEPSNPYASLLADSESKVCYSEGDRAKKERRSEHYRKLFDRWQSQHDQEAQEQADATSPDRDRMRKFAADRLEKAQMSPDAKADQVSAYDNLVKLAEHATPGQFWDVVRSLGESEPAAPATASTGPRNLYEAADAQ